MVRRRSAAEPVGHIIISGFELAGEGNASSNGWASGVTLDYAYGTGFEFDNSDDTIIVESIVQALEEDEFDYEVVSASDGFEAGLQVNHFHPDLVILDIMMPDIKGYEVCKKIKSNDATKGTKIIVLSAYLDDDKFAQMKENGADVCFSAAHAIERRKANADLYPDGHQQHCRHRGEADTAGCVEHGIAQPAPTDHEPTDHDGGGGCSADGPPHHAADGAHAQQRCDGVK